MELKYIGHEIFDLIRLSCPEYRERLKNVTAPKANWAGVETPHDNGKFLKELDSCIADAEYVVLTLKKIRKKLYG